MVDQGMWPLVGLLIFSGTLLVLILRIRNPKLVTLVIAPIFLYLVAGVLGTTQLFIMGTMVLALCGVCYFFSLISLRGVRVSRRAFSPVSQGDFVEIAIQIANHHWLPRLFLRVRSPLPEGLQVEQDTLVIPGLWAGQQVTHRFWARARRRGCYQLPPLELIGADPLDVFQRVSRRDIPTEVVVYPLAEEPPGMELWGDDFFGALPARRMLHPAAGLDFHSLRDYQPGDDVRAIDWKATARLSRLIVVGFEPTQIGDLVVLLDNRREVQAGRGEHSTLERAVSIAAGAVAAVLSVGGTVVLRYLAERNTQHVAGRGRHDLVRFLDALARLEETVGELADLVPHDIRARTVLIITAATGLEVVEAVRRVQGGGGKPVVILLDASRLGEGEEQWTSDGAAWRMQAVEFLSRLGLTAFEDVTPANLAQTEEAAALLRGVGAHVQVVGPGTIRRMVALPLTEPTAVASREAVTP